MEAKFILNNIKYFKEWKKSSSKLSRKESLYYHAGR
jgi:hypothetical protein